MFGGLPKYAAAKSQVEQKHQLRGVKTVCGVFDMEMQKPRGYTGCPINRRSMKIIWILKRLHCNFCLLNARIRFHKPLPHNCKRQSICYNTVRKNIDSVFFDWSKVLPLFMGHPVEHHGAFLWKLAKPQERESLSAVWELKLWVGSTNAKSRPLMKLGLSHSRDVVHIGVCCW